MNTRTVVWLGVAAPWLAAVAVGGAPEGVFSGGGLLSVCVQGSENRLPANGDAMLVLSNATWWAGKPEKPRDVALRLQRLDGAWDPVVVGHTLRGQNASHYGFITEHAAEPEGERLKIRLYVRPDRWIGGEGHSAYTLRLRLDGAACSGSWTGVVQARAKSGMPSISTTQRRQSPVGSRSGS